jgi:hypothetical protein
MQVTAAVAAAAAAAAAAAQRYVPRYIGTHICSTTRILQVERATRKLAEEEEERKVGAAKKKEEEDERAKQLTLTAAERAEVKQLKAALVKSKTEFNLISSNLI